MKTVHLLLAVSLLLLAGACRNSTDWRQEALKAEAEAKDAYEHHDSELAERAAARAEKAATKLARLVEREKPTPPEAEEALTQARNAAASARNYAELALEDQQVRERLSSLKLRGYQRVRGATLSYGLAGLASAAELASRTDLPALSTNDQRLAGLAQSVSSLVQRVPLGSNSAADWNSVAANLRAWSAEPPGELAMFLCLTYALGGFTDLALWEVESVDAARLASTDSRSLYHLERAALLAWNGWDKTATRELESSVRLAPEGFNSLGSTQIVALIHLWKAGEALQKNQLRQADIEISQAMSAWPDNPVAAFLTGEKMAANGEWQKAADSMEARAAGTDSEWLAKRLADRAREIRDTKGNAKPLLTDPAFLAELTVQIIGKSAKESGALKKLEDLISEARLFGSRFLKEESKDAAKK